MRINIPFLSLFLFGIITLHSHDIALGEESYAPDNELYSVTFNLTINPAGPFDPEANTFYISGSMFNWAAPGSDPELQAMTYREDNPYYLSKTVEMPAGVYHYKFYLNEGWEGGEFYCDPDRAVTVNMDGQVEDVFIGKVNYLTLSAQPHDAGTVTGAGAYWTNASVSIEASALGDVSFINWADDQNNEVSTDSVHHFKMPGLSTNMVANFGISSLHEVTFFLDVNCVEGYHEGLDTIFISGSMMQWMPPGEDPGLQMMYPTGDPRYLTRTLMLSNGEHEYKYFLNRNWDGAEWEGGPGRGLLIENENTEIHDIFYVNPLPGDEGHLLTLGVEPESAGQVYGGGYYFGGTTVDIETIANEGYIFEKWTINNQDIGDAEFLEYCMPKQEVTLVAHFSSTLVTNDIYENSLKIFPNPAKHSVSITSGDILHEIQLINLTGQQILNLMPLCNSIQLDITGLTEGLYFLRVHTPTGWKTSKLQISW